MKKLYLAKLTTVSLINTPLNGTWHLEDHDAIMSQGKGSSWHILTGWGKEPTTQYCVAIIDVADHSLLPTSLIPLGDADDWRAAIDRLKTIEFKTAIKTKLEPLGFTGTGTLFDVVKDCIYGDTNR